MDGIWLHNDDSRDIQPDILDGRASAVIVTDPPFNVGYHYAGYKDRMDEGEYYAMLAGMFCRAPSVVIHYPEALYKLAIRMNQAPARVVSWVYNSNTARQHRDAAFFGISPDMGQIRQPYKNQNDRRIRERMERTGGGRSYDWQYADQVKNVSKDKTGHPCQMPKEIMRWLVGILPLDCTIIDPFMGSGTTGLAVLDLNRSQPGAHRRFVGIEMDAGYFGIAKERIEAEASLCGIEVWEEDARC